MRMRKKRNGSERILACSDILVPKETEFTEILQMFGNLYMFEFCCRSCDVPVNAGAH